MSRFFPCGTTRREFVWEMGAGFAGLALSSLLESDGFYRKHAIGAETSRSKIRLSRAMAIFRETRRFVFSC